MAQTNAPFTTHVISDALHIVNHPEEFHDRPSLRTHAWAALKSARGQTIRQANLEQMLRALRPVSLQRPTLCDGPIYDGAA